MLEHNVWLIIPRFLCGGSIPPTSGRCYFGMTNRRYLSCEKGRRVRIFEELIHKISKIQAGQITIVLSENTVPGNCITGKGMLSCCSALKSGPRNMRKVTVSSSGV